MSDKSIDITFVLGKGSLWQNKEIKYSLRSIEKHLTGYRNIWIIGYLPDFLQNVNHIQLPDEHPCKETNIYRKILRACQEERISDDFLFFNDDHFLMQNFEAPNFPFFYKSDLRESSKRMRYGNRYKKAIDNAYRALHASGHDTKSFDTHTPMIYNKANFIKVMPGYDWNAKISFVVKSMYANSIKIEGIREPDCKINNQISSEEIKELISSRKVFSMGDGAIGNKMLNVLEELYPVASKYEKAGNF